jgi:hypothetical protein
MAPCRERCASLAHDLQDAKFMINKYKKDMNTVNALREQIYEIELHERRLKEQVAANKRESLQWKTRAVRLKNDLKNATAAAAREGSKGGVKGAGYDRGGSVRAGEVLPVVTRGHSAFTNRVMDEGRPTAGGGVGGGTDDDEWDDDDQYQEMESRGIGGSLEGTRQQGGAQGKTASNVHAKSGAVSASPTMNFSKVFERVGQNGTRVDLPDDDDVDVRRIWSATFSSREVDGGVHMGAGMGGTDENGRDERSLSGVFVRVRAYVLACTIFVYMRAQTRS